MRLIPHLLGLSVCLVFLFFIHTPLGSSDPEVFYATTGISSYILYSSLALALTRFGKSPKAKAWSFFVGGFLTVTVFMPGIRFVVDQFYVDPWSWREPSLISLKELYFMSPIFVGSFCIYRAFCLWSDESLTEQKPNQPPQTRATSGPV